MILGILTFIYVGLSVLFLVAGIAIMLENISLRMLPMLIAIIFSLVGLFSLAMMSAYHKDIVRSKNLQWIPVRKLACGVLVGYSSLAMFWVVDSKLGEFALFFGIPAFVLSSMYFVIWFKIAKNA